MSGAPLVYSPPAVDTTNVLYGTGIVFTNLTTFASLPSDQNLGVGSAWVSAGWSYVGATDAGVTLTWNPTTVDISIEEQPTPVAVVTSNATAQIAFDFNEETLANVALAYGNAATTAVTAAGASQPGKSVLSLSTNFAPLSVAILGKNKLGFARVFYVPSVMSAGQVATSYRRAANQRMYPCTLSAICPFADITWNDLTSTATS